MEPEGGSGSSPVHGVIPVNGGFKMDKASEQFGKATHRRLSSLKVLVKPLDNELDLSKSDKDIALSRGLVENMLDTVEMFIEDFEAAYGGRTERQGTAENKPQVTRLN